MKKEDVLKTRYGRAAVCQAVVRSVRSAEGVGQEDPIRTEKEWSVIVKVVGGDMRKGLSAWCVRMKVHFALLCFAVLCCFV